MSEEKREALLQRWREWWDEKPNEIHMGKVVLKKQHIHGIPVYSSGIIELPF